MFFLNPLVVAEAFSSASLPLSITSGTGGMENGTRIVITYGLILSKINYPQTS